MGPFRPIAGIENRAPQEVFDIMCERFRSSRNEVIEMCAAKIDALDFEECERDTAGRTIREVRRMAINSIRSLKDHSNG